MPRSIKASHLVSVSLPVPAQQPKELRLKPTTKGLQRLVDARQAAAAMRFDRLFCAEGARAAPFVRRGPQGVVARTVKGVSPKVANAVRNALASPVASVDPYAAANMNHLWALFVGVLNEAAQRRNKPLSQAEVDSLALAALVTGLYAEGRAASELRHESLVPLVSASRGAPLTPMGGAILDHAKRHNHRLRGELQTSALLRNLVAPARIEALAKDAGQKCEAPQLMAAMLTHAVADVGALQLYRADVRVDFESLVASGALPAATARVIEALHLAAIDVAARWHERLLRGPLTEAERARLALDAAPLRRAIKALPHALQMVYVHDTLARVSPAALDKTLFRLCRGVKTNGALIEALFCSAVQPAYEEALAKNLGRRFEMAARKMAERLGMLLDKPAGAAGGTYRPARSDEPAFCSLAQGLMADRPLLCAFEADTRRVVRPADAPKMIAWFKALPAQPADLERLAHPEGM